MIINHQSVIISKRNELPSDQDTFHVRPTMPKIQRELLSSTLSQCCNVYALSDTVQFVGTSSLMQGLIIQSKHTVSFVFQGFHSPTKPKMF